MMIHRRLITLVLFLVCGAAGASPRILPAAQKADPVVIPFELVTRHILIKVQINDSGPLWFIFEKYRAT